jgi:hypothetical protein
MDSPITQTPLIGGEITPQQAQTALENARLKAAVGFEYMVELISLRGFDPTISTTQALAVAEHLYKVSGMAQKQSVQPVLPTVKFTFNATTTSKSVEIDITSASQDLSDQPSYLNNPMAGTPLNVLMADIPEYE